MFAHIINQNVVTLANAVTITNTTEQRYNLITHGGMTEDQIRQYRKFKVSVINSHDQAGTITLNTAVRALGPTGLSSAGTLFTEAGVVVATTGRLILQDRAGGTGSSTQIKVVPSLEGVHSNLFVYVSFAVAPTTGSITIMVEMN